MMHNKPPVTGRLFFSIRIVTEGSKDLLKALPDYQFYKA